MRKEHAEHNEEACHYLNQSGKYNDWVITTAFYSAMHYLQYELFPLEIGDEVFDSFNSYYRSRCRYINDKPSKHQTTIEIVQTRLPNCNRFYRWLHDECFTARYSNYNVTSQKANTAVKYLNSIKAHLNKIK